MVDNALMEAIQAYIRSCKAAVATAMNMSSSAEVEKSLKDLEIAETMPYHPEVFFEVQRNMFLCSSI